LHLSVVTANLFARHNDNTNNVTSQHRGPKRKLRIGYRAPSLKRTSYLCVTLLCCERYIFIVECGIARFLCATHVFEVRASSSSTRLLLCQILFLSRFPLLS